MGLKLGNNPEAYHVIYNGVEYGYVRYNGQLIHTFWHTGPLIDLATAPAGEYDYSTTIDIGKPHKTFSTAGSTLDNWIGAAWVQIASGVDFDTAYNWTTHYYVSSLDADGYMFVAYNKTTDTPQTITSGRTFTKDTIIPYALGIFPNQKITRPIDVKISYSNIRGVNFTYKYETWWSSGSYSGGQYRGRPTLFTIHNTTNKQLKYVCYHTYNDALNNTYPEDGKGIVSASDYYDSISKEISSGGFYKSANRWFPANQTSSYEPNSLYEYATPWTHYYVFYYYDRFGRLLKTKPFEMHIPDPGGSGGGGSGGNPCLIQDTLITMADGGLKPIQEIEVGEEILGYDFYNNKPTKAVVLTVAKTGKHTDCIGIVFSNGESLRVTGGHSLYSPAYGRYLPIEDFKEGDFVLNSNGEQVEILAIYHNFELKNYEQFWHIVSSNNTYFANNIMNANHAVDKYRFMHDIKHQLIEDPIKDIMLDEAKDAGCFEFTATNSEFMNKTTQIQSIIKKAVVEIDDCNREIQTINQTLPKFFVPKILRNMYKGKFEQRVALHQKVSNLQELIRTKEEEYNKLLTEYSNLGEDINLSDIERREKYFKRANKIANDNFNLYKKYYVNMKD